MSNEFLCAAWPAEDDIVPAEPQPNSEHGFFIKLAFEFRNRNNSTRTVRELFVGRHEEGSRRLARDGWDRIRDLLSEMGTPLNVFVEMMMQITGCAIRMVNDPANEGRLVLPIEGLVSCRVEEREEAETSGDGRNTVEVDVEEREAVERRRDGGNTVEVDEAEMCSVCLVEMEVGSIVSRLPCTHEFHVNCVGEWFTRTRSCPMCRRGLD